jgi:hypothetical protein
MQGWRAEVRYFNSKISWYPSNFLALVVIRTLPSSFPRKRESSCFRGPVATGKALDSRFRGNDAEGSFHRNSNKDRGTASTRGLPKTFRTVVRESGNDAEVGDSWEWQQRRLHSMSVEVTPPVPDFSANPR